MNERNNQVVVLGLLKSRTPDGLLTEAAQFVQANQIITGDREISFGESNPNRIKIHISPQPSPPSVESAVVLANLIVYENL